MFKVFELLVSVDVNIIHYWLYGSNTNIYTAFFSFIYVCISNCFSGFWMEQWNQLVLSGCCYSCLFISLKALFTRTQLLQLLKILPVVNCQCWSISTDQFDLKTLHTQWHIFKVNEMVKWPMDNLHTRHNSFVV